jgi:hypothetical protein
MDATTAAATSTEKAAAATEKAGRGEGRRSRVRPPRARLKTFDILIALFSVLAVGLSTAWAYAPGSGEARAVIKGRDGEWVYPLSADRVVDVVGPLGLTRVEILHKAVHIEESACPNKTCIAAGFIEKNGQWIACLPNQVLVRVEGGSSDAGVDASTY